MTAPRLTERMHPADSILWRIERDPILRSTVTAVTLLDRAPDWERLRERMLEATTKIPRLRQVVVEPPLGFGSPMWVPAEDFDLDYHLRRVRLPEGSSFADVLDYAAHEAMSGLDQARPLWEFTVVEGIDEGAALIQKFHHAAADGIGGIRVALEILDTERRARRKVRSITSLGRHDGAAKRSDRAGGTVGRIVSLPGSVAQVAWRSATAPLHSAASAADSLRWSARLLAPVTEPLSTVMRTRGTRLAFRAFDVDLDRLHDAGKRAGGTLNDAYIAAVGAGLRRYHELHGKPVAELRMTLPISIRREEDPLMENRFVPVRFTVPLARSEPAKSIRDIAHLVREWRDGPALALSDGLAALLNTLPTPAVTKVFSSMLRNVDFVATNVPGVPNRVYLAGAELLRQYAFAPPSGAAVNVALLSHVGHCCIGVNMDRSAIEDPDVLVDCLKEGFDEVMSLTPRVEHKAHAARGA